MISRSDTGFTLVELLVVMLIMSLGVALVGGLSVDFSSKYKMLAEEKRLSSILKKASHLAFVHETQISVVTESNGVSIFRKKQRLGFEEFETLRFDDKQSVAFNAWGISKDNELTFYASNNRKQLEIGDAN